MRTSILCVSALALLALGYVLGAMLGFPLVDDSKLKGDIGKAKVYNEVENPEVLAAMEQLANDTALQQQTALSAAILKVRIDEVNSLLASYDSIENMPEEQKNLVKSLGLRADNAQKSFDEYLNALVAVMNGEKVENFEQTANKALLAYTIIEKNINSMSPQLVSALIASAEQNKDEKVANLAAKWVEYGAEAAFLNNSQAEMAYWQSQADVIAKSPVLGKMLNASTLCCNDLSSISKNLLAVTPSKTLEMMLGSNSITLLNQDKILGLVVAGTIDKRSDVAGLALAPALGLRWW